MDGGGGDDRGREPNRRMPGGKLDPRDDEEYEREREVARAAPRGMHVLGQDASDGVFMVYILALMCIVELFRVYYC